MKSAGERQYVPVDLMCYPEVAHYLRSQMEKEGDVLILDQMTSVGKLIVTVLEGKRSTVRPSECDVAFGDSVTLALSRSVFEDVGSVIPEQKALEFNRLMRRVINENLFVFLMMGQMCYQNFHIMDGIQRWLEQMGIPEDVKACESYKRSYLNWRRRRHPEMVRPKGKPSKYAAN